MRLKSPIKYHGPLSANSFYDKNNSISRSEKRFRNRTYYFTRSSKNLCSSGPRSVEARETNVSSKGVGEKIHSANRAKCLPGTIGPCRIETRRLRVANPRQTPRALLLFNKLIDLSPVALPIISSKLDV